MAEENKECEFHRVHNLEYCVCKQRCYLGHGAGASVFKGQLHPPNVNLLKDKNTAIEVAVKRFTSVFKDEYQIIQEVLNLREVDNKSPHPNILRYRECYESAALL